MRYRLCCKQDKKDNSQQDEAMPSTVPLFTRARSLDLCPLVRCKGRQQQDATPTRDICLIARNGNKHAVRHYSQADRGEDNNEFRCSRLHTYPPPIETAIAKIVSRSDRGVDGRMLRPEA
jgi:hypothetical protein